MTVFRRNDDGYKYIRGYRCKLGERYALMERVNGKMKRVGTARSLDAAHVFLGVGLTATA